METTARTVLHYTKQNNGNIHTPVTLEHVMSWIEKYNVPPKTKLPKPIKITSSELI
jgi:hypothetical protein